jgi:Tfp pilus assembly protein PilW
LNREDSDPEAGFSLVELVVAMGIMLLVVGALLSALDSLTGAERTTSTHIDDEQSGRLALAQLGRDAHGSAHVLPQTTMAAYATTADLTLTDGSHVRWAYDGASKTLTRFLVAGDGTAQPSSVLPNATGSFVWSGAATTDLAGAPWATPGDVAQCARGLGATVSVSSRPGLTPQTESMEAALPNQTPQGCGP